MTNLLNELKKRFPEDQIRYRAGPKKKTASGQWEETKFAYIPNSLVSERLDEVFNLNWSWEVKETKIVEVERNVKEKTEPDSRGKYTFTTVIKKVQEVYVLGRLTVYLEDGSARFRHAWGGCELTKGTQAGDGLKIADSNAFKKAAYKFGVAAYIGLDALEDIEPTAPESNVGKRPYNNSYQVRDVEEGGSQPRAGTSAGKPNPFL